MQVLPDVSTPRCHGRSAILDHWGLLRYPFPALPTLSEFLDVGTHGRAVQSVVCAGKGSGHVLVGQRGVGKTAVLTVLGEILDERVFPGWLSNAALDTEAGDRCGKAVLLDGVSAKQLQSLMGAEQGRGRKIVVAVHWPPDERLEQFCVRQGLDYIELRAWSFSETRLAVEQAVRLAGAARPIFTAGALAALFRATAGLPRRVGRLVNLSLLLGAARKGREVSDQDVRAAIAELQTLQHTPSTTSPGRWPSSAA